MSALKQFFDKLLAPQGAAEEFDFTGNSKFNTCFIVSLTDTGEVWKVTIENDHLSAAGLIPVNTGKLGFILDTTAFTGITSGKLPVQKAFLTRKVEIQGGLFKGMILARQLEAFFKKLSAHQATTNEAAIEHEFAEESIRVTQDDGGEVFAVLGYDDNAAPDSIIFIFPPHPMLGGDYDNNVVNQLYETAVYSGKFAVKFNYRMVDNAHSDDEMLRYWRNLEDRAEFERIVGDAQELVWNIVENIGRDLKIDFAAYSFGNFIALQTMRHIAVRKYIGISPPLLEYDFDTLFAEFPGLDFVISEKDDFCPEEQFSRMAEKYGMRLHKVNSDDHFYRGSEAELKQSCLNILENKHA